jgi:hypothetical protein
MAVLPSFQSPATQALKRIHKTSFASSSQRDELIETVLSGGEGNHRLLLVEETSAGFRSS